MQLIMVYWWNSLQKTLPRSDYTFLKEVFSEGIDAGAKRICACDTVGMLTPEKSYKFYEGLIGSWRACECSLS